MARRYFRRQSTFRRSRRPTERTIRAGTALGATPNQISTFTYTADVPMTVTRFKLDIGIAGAAGVSTPDSSLPLVYALVLVPEGYTQNTLTYPAVTGDLYNPTINVLISGVVTDATLEDHKSSSYSRKLKTGDRIALLIRYPNNVDTTIATAWELSFTSVR